MRPLGTTHRFVHVREIRDTALCLYAPDAPANRAYCSVVETSAINFQLKSAEDQVQLLFAYRELLKSLSFPLQILIRHSRLDLAPYLEEIEKQQVGQSVPYQVLAQDLITHLLRLQSHRQLLAGHWYVMIPAPSVPRMLHPFAQFHRRHQQGSIAEEQQIRALDELAIRVDQVTKQLRSLDIHANLLRGTNLARFVQSCYTPGRAAAFPLEDDVLAGVGRPHKPHKPHNHLNKVGEGGVTLTNPIPAETGEPTSLPPVDQQAHHTSDQLVDKSLQHLPLFSALEPGTGRVLSAQELLARIEEEEGKEGKEGKQREREAVPERRVPQTAPGIQKKHRRSATQLPAPDLTRLTDVLAPGSILETHDALCIDGEWMRGIAVVAFKRTVESSGWLAPLLMHDGECDIVMHIHPQDQATMIRQLNRRLSGYSATKKFQARQGHLSDPDMEVAASDVEKLLRNLASGEERVFELSLLVVVRAPDKQSLDTRTNRVQSLLQTVFLASVSHPTTFEHGKALLTLLPECRDQLHRTITLDGMTAATAFPFISNALVHERGVFLGLTGTSEPVLLNPWDASLENPHTFVGGVSGAGKSFLGKLWIERAILLQGTTGEHISVIDPDGEYAPLTQALGGTMVRIAPGSKHALNPFDLLPPGCDMQTYLQESQQNDRFSEKIEDLLGLLELLLAESGTTLSKREKALLSLVLVETYARAGITAHKRTHHRPPPLLRDVATVLKSGVCGKDESELALRMSRYIEGPLSSLFASQTNVDLASHLIAWDIRDMRGELRPLGIYLIADFTWTQAIYQSQQRRALYIDEAASLWIRRAPPNFSMTSVAARGNASCG